MRESVCCRVTRPDDALPLCSNLGLYSLSVDPLPDVEHNIYMYVESE